MTQLKLVMIPYQQQVQKLILHLYQLLKHLNKVNDKILLGDYTITVTNYQAQVTPDKYSQPKSGFKYVAVEVLYENNSSSTTISYNPYDWNLSDTDGYKYTSSWSSQKDPSLSSGDINKGSKARGWLTFEVPTTAVNFTIKFTPNMFSDENAEIQLY